MVNKNKKYTNWEAKQLPKHFPVSTENWSIEFNQSIKHFLPRIVYNFGEYYQLMYDSEIVALFRKSQKYFLLAIQNKKWFYPIFTLVYETSLDEMPLYLNDPVLKPYAAWRIEIAK